MPENGPQITVPQIATFVLSDFQTNCFVVTTPGDVDCWIVDCGFEPDELLDHVSDSGLNPIAILLTHAHSDHIGGVDVALSRLGAMPIYIHTAEAGFCSDPMLNLSALMGMDLRVTEPDHQVVDGDILSLNGTQWRVVHAPGHSPGGVLFVHEESNQAIVGDTLFAGGIGRFDFPTSNVEDLRRTISTVLMSLADDMTIHPGHGPTTTIGHERRTNPHVLQGF